MIIMILSRPAPITPNSSHTVTAWLWLHSRSRTSFVCQVLLSLGASLYQRVESDSEDLQVSPGCLFSQQLLLPVSYLSSLPRAADSGRGGKARLWAGNRAFSFLHFSTAQSDCGGVGWAPALGCRFWVVLPVNTRQDGFQSILPWIKASVTWCHFENRAVWR